MSAHRSPRLIVMSALLVPLVHVASVAAQNAQRAVSIRPEPTVRNDRLTSDAKPVTPIAPGQAVRWDRGGAARVTSIAVAGAGLDGSGAGYGYGGYIPTMIYPDDMVFYHPQQYRRLLESSFDAGKDAGRRETLMRGALDIYKERVGNPPYPPRYGSTAYGGGPGAYAPPSWDAYHSGRRTGEYQAELWLARDRNLLRTAREQIEKGSALFRAGRYAEAADAFRLAARSDHGDAAARLFVGHAYFALGRYADAIGFIRRAFDLQPKIAMLDYGIHALYGNAADFDKHVAALKAAAEARPNDRELWLLLGYVHRYSGNRDAGVAALTRAYEIEPRDRLTRALLDVDPDPKR